MIIRGNGFVSIHFHQIKGVWNEQANIIKKVGGEVATLGLLHKVAP